MDHSSTNPIPHPVCYCSSSSASTVFDQSSSSSDNGSLSSITNSSINSFSSLHIAGSSSSYHSDTLVHHANGPLNALSLSPDHQSVVVAGREVLKILSVTDNLITESLNLRTGARVNLNFSSNDVKWCNDYSKNTIATAATNGAIVIWDIAQSGHKLDRVINEHQRAVNRISFHPTEPVILVSASQDGNIKIWDLRMKSNPARYTFKGKAESARDVQFSPTIAYEFVAAFENGVVQVWDLRHTHTYERRFSAHNSLVLAVDYHKSGRWLATGGRDKFIKVWDLKTKPTVQAEFQFQTIASVGRLAWRPDAAQLASSALLTDSRILVWDLGRPYVPNVWLDDHFAVTTGFSWSNSNVLWSCGKDKLVVRRDIRTAYRPALHLPRSAVSWGPKGDLMASIHSMDTKPPVTTTDQPPGATPGLFTRRTTTPPSLPNHDDLHLVPFVHNQTTVHVVPAAPVPKGEWVHDIQALVYQADNYSLKGGLLFVQSCTHNAEIAKLCGRVDQWRTWQLAALVLVPLAHANLKLNDSPSTSTMSAPPNPPKQDETTVSSPVIAGSIRSSIRSALDPPPNKSPFNTSNLSTHSSGNLNSTGTAIPATPLDSLSNSVGLGLTSPYSPPDSLHPHSSSSTRGGVHVKKNSSACSVHGKCVGWRGGTTAWPIEDMDSEDSGLGLGSAELMVKSLLMHHMDAGDLHITATLTILLLDGRHGGSSSSYWPHWLVREQVEEWFVEYIDLLHRFKRYVIAAEVLDRCPVPEVRARLQQSTTIQTLCNMCFKPIMNEVHPNASWICDRCSRTVNPCSVCHRIVKGQYAWCQGCGHGGHVQCLSAWNNAGNTQCPTGCGHQCR